MNEESLISNFLSITSSSDIETARSYLEMANWELEDALKLFFDTQETKTPEKTVGSQVKPQTNPSGIRTFSDFTSKNEDDDSEKYYAGGSRGSGVQIQGPDKKQNVPSYIDDVFQKAKDSGATDTWEYDKQRDKFSGKGYTLGDTNYGTSKPVESKEDVKVTITFYKNGFIVIDGPLRDYNDPDNNEFLNDISRGVVPQELERLAVRGRHFETHLIDKKGEDYIAPKKPITFEGEGHSLISNTNQSSYITSGGRSDYSLDESKPMTTIQIRLHDGQRVKVKFNKNHKVGDICSWVEKQLNLPSGTRYELLGGYPSKSLDNLDVTIEEANLGGSMIVQKMC